MLILQKTWDVLFSPQKFFSRAKKESGIKQAFLFSVALSPVSIILGLLLNQQNSLAAALVEQLAVSYQAAILMIFGVTWLMSVLIPFAVAAFYHIFVLIVKGKGGYAGTYKAVTYSSAPAYLLGWLWFPGWIATTVWSIALTILGYKQLHSLNLNRSILAIALPLLIIFAIAFFISMLSALRLA